MDWQKNMHCLKCSLFSVLYEVSSGVSLRSKLESSMEVSVEHTSDLGLRIVLVEVSKEGGVCEMLEA